MHFTSTDLRIIADALELAADAYCDNAGLARSANAPTLVAEFRELIGRTRGLAEEIRSELLYHKDEESKP